MENRFDATIEDGRPWAVSLTGGVEICSPEKVSRVSVVTYSGFAREPVKNEGAVHPPPPLIITHPLAPIITSSPTPASTTPAPPPLSPPISTSPPGPVITYLPPPIITTPPAPMVTSPLTSPPHPLVATPPALTISSLPPPIAPAPTVTSPLTQQKTQVETECKAEPQTAQENDLDMVIHELSDWELIECPPEDEFLLHQDMQQQQKKEKEEVKEEEVGEKVKEEEVGEKVKEELVEEVPKEPQEIVLGVEDSHSNREATNAIATNTEDDARDTNYAVLSQPSMGLELISQMVSSSSQSEDSSSSSSSEESSDESVGIQERLKLVVEEEGDETDFKGFIDYPKVKGEIDYRDLPPAEECFISFPAGGCLLPVGRVSHQTEQLVVIEALEGTPAIDEGTVLWSESRLSLARVFETFGRVEKPYYSVRVSCNMAQSLCPGSLVYVIPGSHEHTRYVFTKELIKQKGSDASWKNDTEVPSEYKDYSDDECEKEAKRRKHGGGREKAGRTAHVSRSSYQQRDSFAHRLPSSHTSAARPPPIVHPPPPHPLFPHPHMHFQMPPQFSPQYAVGPQFPALPHPQLCHPLPPPHYHSGYPSQQQPF